MVMFSDKLKYWRQEKGYSQKQLAEQIHVSQQALAKWEAGTSTPNPDTIQEIARLLGIPVSSLFDDDGLSDDNGLAELLQEAKDRPEVHALFSLTKNATREDVEKTIEIIKVLRNSNNPYD
jgi:transcriptional regulator with XRE-family HTH domain